MAEDKKGFVLYADYKELFCELTDEEAGQLIKHIFKYVNDENPIAENQIVKLSFIPIKQQLKRDLQKWDNIRKKRSLAGKASAEKRQQTATKATSVKSVQQSSTNPTVSVNDNVTVNVNDNVINKIYSLYPSKCPIKLNSTGKGIKDKDKIKKLLLSITEDTLIKTIEWYIADCKKTNTYMKNFSTFLNNIPDIEESKPSQEKTYSYKIHFTTYRHKTEKQYSEDLERHKDNLILL